MKKKLSPLGYAIIFVLLVAVIMLVSSPALMKNYKQSNKDINYPNPKQSVQKESVYVPPMPEDKFNPANNDSYNSDRESVLDLERRLNDRINEIESKAQSRDYGQSISDKYICSIEGGLNEEGVVVPIDPDNPPAKFVFACEYRR